MKPQVNASVAFAKVMHCVVLMVAIHSCYFLNTESQSPVQLDVQFEAQFRKASISFLLCTNERERVINKIRKDFIFFFLTLNLGI